MPGPWLVTVPYGVQHDNFWSCFECIAKGAGRPSGQIRDEASGHIKATGHMVTVHHGTAELMVPLDTTAPPLKELTP